MGYKDPKQTIKKYIEKEDKKQIQYLEIVNVLEFNYDAIKNSHPQTIYLNESGLYNLIFQSKLQSAKKFKYWVTREVLPSIRRYGIYKHKKVCVGKLNDSTKKISRIVNENVKLKSLIKKEKYPEGGLVYAIDYSEDNKEIYRIGKTNDLNDRKSVYNIHTLYNKKVAHYEFYDCPIQFESCILGLLYKHRHMNSKDFFERDLKKVKRAFRMCKRVIQKFESDEVKIKNCGNNTNQTGGSIEDKQYNLKKAIREELKTHEMLNQELNNINKLLFYNILNNINMITDTI